MKPEIERKFLLKKFPKSLIGKKKELQKLFTQRIYQTYLGFSDKEEVRVRRIVNTSSKEEKFIHTIKRDSGKGYRLEEETEIGKSLYQQIMKNSGLKPLVKKRTTLKMGKYTIEIDEYSDFDLIVVEVEFDSIEDMKAFKPPKWFGKEINGVKKYSNKTLWKETQKKKKKKK